MSPTALDSASRLVTESPCTSGQRNPPYFLPLQQQLADSSHPMYTQCTQNAGYSPVSSGKDKLRGNSAHFTYHVLPYARAPMATYEIFIPFIVFWSGTFLNIHDTLVLLHRYRAMKYYLHLCDRRPGLKRPGLYYLLSLLIPLPNRKFMNLSKF